MSMVMPSGREEKSPGVLAPGGGRRSKVREYIEAILLATLLALFLRTFVIQAFKIPTPSMVPSLLVGDHILVNKYVYGWKMPFVKGRVLPLWKPRRGDVVVFPFPQEPGTDFVKRCVAVGGDTVELRDRTLYINGAPAEDGWAHYTNKSAYGRGDFGPYTVPEGSIFVMGDNRDNSNDSRFWGPVAVDSLKGKAMVVYWSSDLSRPVLPWLRWPWAGNQAGGAILYFPRFSRVGSAVR